MNHPQNTLMVIAHIESAMNTDSTVGELAPHVTREQAAFLADCAAWLTEIVAARPPIQPAKAWPTPTDHKRNLAARIKTENERSIDRGRRRRAR